MDYQWGNALLTKSNIVTRSKRWTVWLRVNMTGRLKEAKWGRSIILLNKLKW